MTKFLATPFELSLVITFILAACVLIQTLTILFSFYRNRLQTVGMIENILEILILLQILVLSIMHGQMLNNYKSGFNIPIGAEYLRIAVFSFISVLAIWICLKKKTPRPLSIIFVSAISLPFLEDSFGNLFPLFFIFALTYFLVRSIKSCVRSIHSIKTNISALSISYAINTLQSGILFSEKDGHTLLSNDKMKMLMIAFAGEIYRNALEFYTMLTLGQDESRYKKVELDQQVVYLLPDETAWMFTKTEITIKTKNYIHISAIDVSEQWKLTLELRLQGHELSRKSQELNKTISNLYFLSKEKETENAKMRAHDILGQRLTVLLHTMQMSKHLDYQLLTSLTKGLLAELKAEQNKMNPYDEIKSIQYIFSAIGVTIRFDGQLPVNEERARLYVDIIRESSTNAVRHGFATQISIKAEQKETTTNLTIVNNGFVPSFPITLGSGIGMMKKKVCSLGGSLDVIRDSTFTLLVVLPRGDEYD